MDKKLLLVDDDPDDRDLFCEAIESIDGDLHCYTAPSGRAALMKLLGQEIERPDIIFVDINMPVMNGWECLSILKATPTLTNIPVIMYSTSSHAEDGAKAAHAGALSFFTKPGSFTELTESLRQIVRHIREGSLSTLSPL